MQAPFAVEIPEETLRLVEPLLPAAACFGWWATEAPSDEEFPVLERLPDRAGAEAVVMRRDWEYAVRQGLAWSGFHYPDLCTFRGRLLEHGRERVEYERPVTYPRDRGYITGRGQQRTDATPVIGLVACLSRLDRVLAALGTAGEGKLGYRRYWQMPRPIS